MQEYRIADPGNRTVHVYTLKDGRYRIRQLYAEQETIQSVMIPELTVPMTRLFGLSL